MKKIKFNKTKSIVDTNIFQHPQYIKAWAKKLIEACGSTEMNIPPDMGRLKWLMDKFVKDYNEQLGDLEPMKEEE